MVKPTYISLLKRLQGGKKSSTVKYMKTIKWGNTFKYINYYKKSVNKVNFLKIKHFFRIMPFKKYSGIYPFQSNWKVWKNTFCT